jgi:hypothetical protein
MINDTTTTTPAPAPENPEKGDGPESSAAI